MRQAGHAAATNSQPSAVHRYVKAATLSLVWRRGLEAPLEQVVGKQAFAALPSISSATPASPPALQLRTVHQACHAVSPTRVAPRAQIAPRAPIAVRFTR